MLTKQAILKAVKFHIQPLQSTEDSKQEISGLLNMYIWLYINASRAQQHRRTSQLCNKTTLLHPTHYTKHPKGILKKDTRKTVDPILVKSAQLI